MSFFNRCSHSEKLEHDKNNKKFLPNISYPFLVLITFPKIAFHRNRATKSDKIEQGKGTHEVARSQATVIKVLTARSIGIISAWRFELPRTWPAPAIKAVDPFSVSTNPGMGSRNAGPTNGTRTSAMGPSSPSFPASTTRSSLARSKMLVTTATTWIRDNCLENRNVSLHGPAAWNTTLTFPNSSLSLSLMPKSLYDKLPSIAFTRERAFGSSCLNLSNL